MTEHATAHSTVVIERTLDAPPVRVFAAWSNPASLGRWYVPGDETWTSRVDDHDFRVGGRKLITFGPPDARFSEDCRYEDIVDQRRICFSMTIARGDARLTTSMVTVEIAPRGQRTILKVTDQLVVLDGGDTSAERERGWGETLDKLSAELRRLAG